jgi:hypothetical protein
MSLDSNSNLATEITEYTIVKVPPDTDPRQEEVETKECTLGQARRWAAQVSLDDATLLVMLFVKWGQRKQAVMNYCQGREFNP